MCVCVVVFLCGESVQSLGVLRWGLMDERHSLLAVVVSLWLLFLLSCLAGLCAVAGHLVVKYYSAVINCILSSPYRETELKM